MGKSLNITELKMLMVLDVGYSTSMSNSKIMMTIAKK
jgi:hypothetical protein